MRVIILILWLFHVALPAQAQTLPDYQDLYVNDFAGMIPDEDAQIIRAKLQELKTARGIEFTLVTINSMTDYSHDGPIEPFATALFNHWGVGNAQRNDGVMMLIALQDRHMRIEVGSGYGLTKNAPMQEIIDDVIIPRFRRGAYLDGIHHGVDHVIHEVAGVWPGEYDASTAERLFGGVKRTVDRMGAWIWAFLAPLAGGAAALFRRWRRYHPRSCPVDGTKMQLLDEDWDDNHLQDGQITEERLKSVDYDVWQCPKCAHVTVEAYKSWFSRYGACRSCGYRTVEGTTTIITPATTSSTGLKRIDYDCHHCHDSWSATHTIPRKSESNSSSSGSFGGGSSSGGGASGSW